MTLPQDHPEVITPKVGILLVNLGTPDATDKKSMRRYLKQFLSDERVIETPRWLWWPILNFDYSKYAPQKIGRGLREYMEQGT